MAATAPKRGRPRTRGTTDNVSGLARGGAEVRELAASYSASKRNGINERYLSGVLHGYLGAIFRDRLRREVAVGTNSLGRGRPEQIDFALGRKKHGGAWKPTVVIEFAVRRKGHLQGIDPSCNASEVSKLCRADAKHRVLLLIDLTMGDYGQELKIKYLKYKRSPGRPLLNSKISVVYVGEHGTERFSMPAQRLARKKKKKEA